MRILAQLRLLPAMYGRDITVAMTQRYTGDVTVVPRLGGPGALLRIVQNPTRKMMSRYIHPPSGWTPPLTPWDPCSRAI